MAIRKEQTIELSTKKTLEVHTECYDCANDVVEDCKNRPVRISGYRVSGSFKKDWEGVSTYDEALALLRDGYQSAVENFKNALKVSDKYGPRFAFENNVHGFAPIVPLAIKGIPTCMHNMTLRPLKAKVLDVYYDTGVIASYGPEQLIKAGETVLGTILELERMGYKFNLYAVQSYYGPSQKALDILCVKVKSSNTPLDLKRMAFPLVHPAFFRVIGFDWQGKSPVTRDIGCGRGKDFATNVSKEDVKMVITTTFGNNACYIPATTIMDSNYNKDVLKKIFTDVKPKK